jgi:HD-GYP domain-containing protein (c-di-GMP phosphodiesterase class II)
VALELGFDAGDIDEIRLGGELHDVGKIGVPDRLLCKPCPLTFDEFRRVTEHTLIGEQILLPLLQDHPAVLEVVRWHHERFDGNGTPDGLQGDKIPLGVRVVTVADCFDAMTTAREYRSPLSLSAAVEELQNGAGSQFDPDCVQAFLSVLCDTAVLPPAAASGACA